MSFSTPMWKARLSELEFDERELAEVRQAIDSRWITSGPRTQAFESAFARVIGTAEAIAVSNGTAALFLALKAIEVGPGDEVLVPSLTFVATAAAVIHCGATPVLVDISTLENPTMCAVDAARQITSRTRAIVPVHYAGIPADMDRLSQLAGSKKIILIEDAAHAPGAHFEGRACGSFGAAGCFSFFANKNITTGEGGMITTNDTKLAQRLRLLRSHGMSVSSWDRNQGRPSHYDVLEFGFNFRFDDIRAGLGLAQLAKLELLTRQRSQLVQRYNQLFTESGLNLTLPFAYIPSAKQPSYHIYPIVLADTEERDLLAHRLQAEGIQTSIHYPPLHTFSAFTRLGKRVTLPFTNAFASRELTLPLYPSLSESQVDQIVAATLQALRSIRGS